MPQTPALSPPFGLTWAVKKSFLSYVARSPGGRAYVDGGVTVTSENELIFPHTTVAASGDAHADGVITFGGEVRFIAHGGLLYVHLAEPSVQMTDDTGILTVTSSNEDGEPVRVPLASFAVTSKFTAADAQGWKATEVRLSPEGVGLFSDVYPAGEALAPLSLRLPLS